MIHKYYLSGMYILLDVDSGAVHVVDKIIFDILDFINLPLAEQCEKNILNNKNLQQYNQQDLIDAYNEIYELYKSGQLFSSHNYEKFANGQFNMPVKAMCLHVAHDCNLRCRYCFASTGNFGHERNLMPLDVAKKAVDFLISRSDGRKNLEMDFFGGEP